MRIHKLEGGSVGGSSRVVGVCLRTDHFGLRLRHVLVRYIKGLGGLFKSERPVGIGFIILGRRSLRVIILGRQKLRVCLVHGDFRKGMVVSRSGMGRSGIVGGGLRKGGGVLRSGSISGSDS